MQIELTERELGLCIGAMEVSARDLREGDEASKRLGITMPVDAIAMAKEMETLHAKLMEIVRAATVDGQLGEADEG